MRRDSEAFYRDKYDHRMILRSLQRRLQSRAAQLRASASGRARWTPTTVCLQQWRPSELSCGAPKPFLLLQTLSCMKSRPRCGCAHGA